MLAISVNISKIAYDTYVESMKKIQSRQERRQKFLRFAREKIKKLKEDLQVNEDLLREQIRLGEMAEGQTAWNNNNILVMMLQEVQEDLIQQINELEAKVNR